MGWEKLFTTLPQFLQSFAQQLNSGYFEALEEYKAKGTISDKDAKLIEFFGVESATDLYTFTTKVPMFINEKFYNASRWVDAVSDKWKVVDTTHYYHDGEETDVGEIKIKIGPKEEVECVYEATRFFEGVDGKRFVVEITEREANMKLLLSAKFYAVKDDSEFIKREVIPSFEAILNENIFKNKAVSIGNGFEFLEPVLTTYVLPDKLKAEVDNIQELVGNLDQLVKMNLKTSSGLILYGPPGTGKTSFLRHIINSVHGRATVFLVTAKGFNVGTLVGVYELARELAPSIIMFEDMDLIAKDRESGQFMGVMNELLNLMDGHKRNTGVITLATTNFIDEIDKALTNRPGRFDRKIKIDFPTKAERRQIFETYLGEALKNIPSEVIDALIDKVDDHFSNDHLREIVEQAKLLSYRENRDQEVVMIEERHLDEALSIVTGQTLAKVGSRIGFITNK